MDVIQVLDHGHVRLVETMGSDLSIVRNARVSYDADWRAGEDEGSDTKLINSMMTRGHSTPFEAGTVTFDIKAPIFVLRQWHRHRTQSYNELSARYRALPEEFYVPEPWLIGKQSQTDKQIREVMTKEQWEIETTDSEKRSAARIIESMRNCNENSFDEYRYLLGKGVPRELARSVLPVATYSHMFCTMNLFNLFRFLRLRLDHHAQYEIRVYAEAMLELISPVFPVTMEAFAKTLGSGDD